MLLKLTGYAPAQGIAQTFAGRKPEPQILPSQKPDKVELTFGSLSLKDINLDKISVSKPAGAHELTGCRLRGDGFSSRPLSVYTGPLTGGYSARPARTAVAPSIMRYGMPDIKQDVPLSTAGAEDCAMFFFYNDEKKTHGFLHFTHKQAGVKSQMPDQIDRMPKGFNRVVIVPGSDSSETLDSIKLGLQSISAYLESAPKEENPSKDVQVEFKHADYQPVKAESSSTKDQPATENQKFKPLSEVVSYNGTVYSVLPEQKNNEFGSLFQWLDNGHVDNWF